MRKKVADRPLQRPALVRYSLTQIARDLGVSLTTVSRTLSGTGRISQEMRRKILNYAEELQRKSQPVDTPPLMKRMLGLFTPWYSLTPGMSTSVATTGQQAVRGVCEEHGFGLVVSSFGNPSNPTVGDDLLRGGALAGLVLCRTREEPAIAADLSGKGIPHVFVYRNLEGAGLNYVGIDFEEPVRLAVDHCLERGFRELGLLLGHTSYPSHRAYREAFLTLAGKHQLSVSDAWLEEVDVTEEEGYRAATRMLAAGAHPRALICCSDRLAFGVLRAIHDAGLRVPRDIGIVTIDGTLPAAYTRPSLTAVQIPWHEMFALAARFVLEMATGNTALNNIGARLRCQLIVRESTGG